MVNVCVDGNFRVVNGVLDIQQWVGRQLMASIFTTATNEGAFTVQAPLPGVNHIDTTATWTNPWPVQTQCEVILQRSWRMIRASQPNLVFLRERCTVAVDATPADPSVVDQFDSEFGGGYDRHTPGTSTPAKGTWYRWQSASSYSAGTFVVPSGKTITAKYRCAHYSPDPWVDNANNNSAQYQAVATRVTVQFWTFPVANLSGV